MNFTVVNPYSLMPMENQCFYLDDQEQIAILAPMPQIVFKPLYGMSISNNLTLLVDIKGLFDETYAYS